MIQVEEVATTVDPIKEQKLNKIEFFKIAVKELLAILFWAYAIIKLFFFDIDVFMVSKILPEYIGFLYLKFFIVVGVISAIWLFVKSKKILPWLLYIIFYPAILFLWKIPYYVFKQKNWMLAIVFTNFIISFYKSIKYNFITSAFYFISIVIILNFYNQVMIWLAMIIIFGLVLTTYIYRFILVFKPSSEFQIYVKIFSKIKIYGNTSFTIDNIKNLPIESLDEKQIEKRTTNLQMSVLYNCVCLFVAKKLKVYQNSGFNFLYYVLTILMLIIITVFSFAVINYGLFMIDNAYYSYSEIPHFFTFIYYSFNNILFNSIRELVPILPLSQTLYMMEAMFELFLVIIFISLLFTLRSQKHVNELNRIINEIEFQGNEMECFIKDEYKINSINDAIIELEKLKAGLVSFIYKISESIR